MLNERLEAARRVAKLIRDFEAAIDEALVRGSELTAGLPTARLSANLSATVGQDAFDCAAEAIRTITRARREVVSCHQHLDETRIRIGLREMSFGDMLKVPNRAENPLSVVGEHRAA